MSFDGRLGDGSLGYLAEPKGGSGTTLMAFGGIRGGLGIPPYEFFRVTEGLGVRRIFVRDLDQVWYLRGIRGLGSDPREAADALRRETVGERVVTTGNSSGGFAAVLLGSLMGADAVHGFSPQTAIDRAHRLRWLDLRWVPQMHGVRRLHPDRDVLDLRRHLEAQPASPSIHLHYSATDRRDTRHAEHLDGLPGVTLHRYRHGGHRLVTDLRDSGELAAILRGATGGV